MNLRPFVLDDVDGLNALRAEAAWAPLPLAHWQWHHENPAQEDSIIGWVIDNDGSLDGFMGNFIQNYYRGDTRYRAATCHEIIVSKRARGGAKVIMRAFLDQTGVFLGSTLNANTLSAPIHRKLGLTPLPNGTDALKLSWPVSRPTLAMAKALRLTSNRFPKIADRLGEYFTPERARHFKPEAFNWPTNTALISDLGDTGDYARFWQALVEDGRLVADRSPSLMRWRTRDPNLYTPPLLLGWQDDKSICAYAMAQLSKMATIDAPVLEIIDLVALDRAPAQAVPELVDALLLAARAMGASKLRLHVLSETLKQQLGPKLDSARMEGGWGHGHAHFYEKAESFADWNLTPFDGCYSYNLRQPRFRGMAA